MACLLYMEIEYALELVDTAGFGDMLLDDLPESVQKYAQCKCWQANFLDCFKRLGLRLINDCKGFDPNCTGEEMALSIIIYRAKSTHDDDPVCDVIIICVFMQQLFL